MPRASLAKETQSKEQQIADIFEFRNAYTKERGMKREEIFGGLKEEYHCYIHSMIAKGHIKTDDNTYWFDIDCYEDNKKKLRRSKFIFYLLITIALIVIVYLRFR